jgi:hypothetical protein
MDFLGVLGFMSDAVDAQIQSVIVWATAQFSVMYGDVQNVSLALDETQKQQAGLWSSLWTWLTGLWDWLNRTIIQRLKDLIQRIHDKLKEIFGPLLDYLKRLRDRYRELWLQYVKPIYDFLQRLRRVLVLFRLLGFKWAQRLDARIVALETALTNSFLAVWSNLNMLANWINYILDPFGLFQPSVWLRSIQASIGAIIGLGTQKMTDPGFTTNPLQYSTAEGYYQRDTMTARIHARNLTGTLPEDDACMASLRATAASLGYTT